MALTGWECAYRGQFDSIQRGGASLRAAEQDRRGLIDAVVVSEPNVNPVFDSEFVITQEGQTPLAEHSRSLLDYTTLLNLYQGCANSSLPLAPFNLTEVADDAAGIAQCVSIASR